tara:strand:- start:4293 stop:5600 length:1308 start_codon:yes stop_codon:yes gene_type:complete
MTRTLTRPMFRKGGLSQETGIMSGLDRKGYAGGGNIGGGRISGTPMGSRTGFQQLTFSGMSGAQVPALYDPPKIDRMRRLGRGFRNLIGTKGSGIKRRIGSGISSLYNKIPEAGLMSKYPAATGTAATVGPLAAYVYGAKKLQESLPEQLQEEGGLYDTVGFGADPMGAGADIPPEVDKILRGKEINIQGEPLIPEKEKKEEKEEKEQPKLKSDFETIYGDLLPMIEKELGSDPEDTKKQLYVQLAQAGANLLAQPGGDLVGAIGKATKDPISNVGKVLEKESATDREAKLLAFKLAADKASPGETGKLIQDLKNEGYSSDQISKIIAQRQPGAGYRASADLAELGSLQAELNDEFQKATKGKDVPLNTARDLKTAMDNFGMGASDFKVLPKKEDRIPGEYYFDPKTRKIGRLSEDGKKLIRPSESGFMDQPEQE